MSYTGDTIKDLNITRPDGSLEYISIVDDAIKEIKRAIVNDKKVTSVSSNYTITATDSVIICTGSITVTLPRQSNVSTSSIVKEYVIINNGSGTVTIATTSPDTTPITSLPAGSVVSLIGNGGTAWLERKVINSVNATNATNAVNSDKVDNYHIDATGAANNDPVVFDVTNSKLKKGFAYVPGTIAQVVTVQTRTQGLYSAPTSGNGTEITPISITITPKKAGNIIILDWHVNGECNHETVYIAQRNGSLLANTTNGSNNRWAGIIAQPFDTDTLTTPDNAIVRIIDYNSLNITTTYSLHIRSSWGTAHTLYLNRTVNSSGADEHETTLSTGVATEVWT